MMKKRLNRLVAVALMVIAMGGAGVVGAAPAQAAPPPKGYRTDQVMAEVKNPIYGTIPIRRGFYDADAGKGWGMDKAWHYHNIRTLAGQKILMGSNNAAEQGNGNIDLKTYVGYYKCPDGSRVCTLKKQVLVHGIYAPNDANYILGWPVGGKVGLFNAYCENPDRAIKCPDWVTFSLNNPGKDNPYTSRVAPGSGPTPQPTNGAARARTAESAELSDAVFQYSYDELATTVPAAQIQQ